MRFGVYLRAELEGVSRLELANTRWNLSIKCDSCGEINENVWVEEGEVTDISGSRGEAGLVIKCSLCGRENNASLEECKGAAPALSENEEETCFAVFECRGLSLEAWHVGAGWQVVSASGETFEDVDLEEGEWYDVEEQSGQPISVTAICPTVQALKAGGGKGKKKGKKSKK